MFEYNKSVQKKNWFLLILFFFVLRIVKHRGIIVHEDKTSSYLNLNCPSDQIMEYLEKIWNDPRHPGSFAGPSKLYQVVKREEKYDIGLGKIKKVFTKPRRLLTVKESEASRVQT